MLSKSSLMKKKEASFIVYFVLCILLIMSCKKEDTTKKPNILLICVDDLRPELNSFGAKHMISPNIDKLAQQGVSFQSHYVNAPSCGPSRYTLLTGKYGPAGNNALFLRSERISDGENIDPSMPEWFKTNGYTTVSVGKVSHHPGGRGGINWNDSTIIEIPDAWDKHLMPVAEWEHPRGMMHGLAHGEIRVNSGDMDVYQSLEGNDDIYPDGAITNEALKQLKALSMNDEKPFFLAVGFLKPHLPFGAPKSYLDKYEDIDFPEIAHPERPIGRTTWHKSGEFNQYNKWGKDPNVDKPFANELRRRYAACVSYADAQVGRVLDALKRSEKAENTIVILWGDHGWHLGEHAIWGKHSLFEEALHSPMIIYDPRSDKKGFKTNAIVETLDIFPTLCDLTGIKKPQFVEGVSLKNILEKKDTIGHFALAYKQNATTIRTATHRLVLHKDGFVELYDHSSHDNETKNVADNNPELVQYLKKEIEKGFE